MVGSGARIDNDGNFEGEERQKKEETQEEEQDAEEDDIVKGFKMMKRIQCRRRKSN